MSPEKTCSWTCAWMWMILIAGGVVGALTAASEGGQVFIFDQGQGFQVDRVGGGLLVDSRGIGTTSLREADALALSPGLRDLGGSRADALALSPGLGNVGTFTPDANRIDLTRPPALRGLTAAQQRNVARTDPFVDAQVFDPTISRVPISQQVGQAARDEPVFITQEPFTRDRDLPTFGDTRSVVRITDAQGRLITDDFDDFDDFDAFDDFETERGFFLTTNIGDGRGTFITTDVGNDRRLLNVNTLADGLIVSDAGLNTGVGLGTTTDSAITTSTPRITTISSPTPAAIGPGLILLGLIGLKRRRRCDRSA